MEICRHWNTSAFSHRKINRGMWKDTSLIQGKCGVGSERGSTCSPKWAIFRTSYALQEKKFFFLQLYFDIIHFGVDVAPLCEPTLQMKALCMLFTDKTLQINVKIIWQNITRNNLGKNTWNILNSYLSNKIIQKHSFSLYKNILNKCSAITGYSIIPEKCTSTPHIMTF